jgi:hypothetical protein
MLMAVRLGNFFQENQCVPGSVCSPNTESVDYVFEKTVLDCFMEDVLVLKPDKERISGVDIVSLSDTVWGTHRKESPVYFM